MCGIIPARETAWGTVGALCVTVRDSDRGSRQGLIVFHSFPLATLAAAAVDVGFRKNVAGFAPRSWRPGPRWAHSLPCHRSSADRRRTIDDGCERRGLEGDSRNAAIAAIGRSGRDCSCCIGLLRAWCSMQHNLCAISLIERGCVAARTCNFFSLSLRNEQIRR